jgi:hypothetical protein
MVGTAIHCRGGCILVSFVVRWTSSSRWANKKQKHRKRRRLLRQSEYRAQPTGFGAIGGAPGLRGLTLSGEGALGGCVAKLATCSALRVDTVAIEPIVCVGAAAPWGGGMPAATILARFLATIRASPYRVLTVARRPPSEGIQLAGEVTVGGVDLTGPGGGAR